MTSLAQRLGVPPHPSTDLTGMTDAEAAAVLNAPDPSLPEIVVHEKTIVTPAVIMRTLGKASGAQFLTALETASTDVDELKWGFWELKNGGLDIADPVVRAGVTELAQGPIPLLTAAHRDAILALSERRRFPSWAEANNIDVTARTVGLARGAI